MEVSGTFSMIQRPALPLTLMQSTENRSRFLWDYSVPLLTQKSSRFEWAIIRTQFDDSLLVKMKDKGMSSPGARWLFLSGHQIVRMHSGEADKRRLRFSLLRLETPVGEPVPCTALFLGGTSLSEVCQFSSQKCHSKKETDFTRVWIQLTISTRISSFLYTISALNNWVWISKSQRQSGKWL